MSELTPPMNYSGRERSEVPNHSKVKKCPGCKIIKSVSQYYKAGNTIQSLCKPCHNKSRTKYKQNKKKYTKKNTGFSKLDPAIQDDILYMLEIQEKLIDICEKHNIKYKTFLSWRYKNTIPSTPDYILDRINNEL